MTKISAIIYVLELCQCNNGLLKMLRKTLKIKTMPSFVVSSLNCSCFESLVQTFLSLPIIFFIETTILGFIWVLLSLNFLAEKKSLKQINKTLSYLSCRIFDSFGNPTLRDQNLWSNHPSPILTTWSHKSRLLLSWLPTLLNI